MVEVILGQVCARLPAGVGCPEALRSAGLQGLLLARESFAENRGTRFKTYASIRIRGAMVDELRRGDPLSRGARRRQRKLGQLVEAFEQRQGREARPGDIDALAREHGLGRAAAVPPRFVSLEALGAAGPGAEEAEPGAPNAAEAAEHRDACRLVGERLVELPPRERTVLEHYYLRGWTQRQIGELLGLSESLVSRTRLVALRLLRRALGPELAA